ncbi:MAG: inositol monophosphatase family protein [Planctomycetes bacterium]|nr:inositol monophosphatase family protein [Planctomycetota bacterium]
MAEGIARARVRLRPGDVRRKAIGDFVTSLDLRGERQLRRALQQLLPEAGFLGEETPSRELDRELVWVVDPIDGTSNFSRGLPQFAVSVALLRHGQPVLAAVHCAPEQALYSAVLGGGAARGRRKLITGPARFDDGAMVGCQWFRGQQQLAFLAALQSTGARIRTLGSTVVQMIDVVSGRLDANVQEQGRLWDFAASGLIATEAGLEFTDWRGRPVFPVAALDSGHTATIAAPRNVHRRIRALLAGFCEVVGD